MTDARAATSWYFRGGWLNDCNLSLYLTTNMFLKILGEGEIARLPPLVAGLTDANAVCQ